jgi:hypothetical protein
VEWSTTTNDPVPYPLIVLSLLHEGKRGILRRIGSQIERGNRQCYDRAQAGRSTATLST